MTTGIATADANGVVNAFASSIDYAGPSAFWVRLHNGDPGSNGLGNTAAESDRKLAGFASSAAGLAASNTDLIWTTVVSTETYAYVSFWDDPTAGSFHGSSVMTIPRPVVAGDDFIIPQGALTAQLIPLAA